MLNQESERDAGRSDHADDSEPWPPPPPVFRRRAADGRDLWLGAGLLILGSAGLAAAVALFVTTGRYRLWAPGCSLAMALLGLMRLFTWFDDRKSPRATAVDSSANDAPGQAFVTKDLRENLSSPYAPPRADQLPKGDGATRNV